MGNWNQERQKKNNNSMSECVCTRINQQLNIKVYHSFKRGLRRIRGISEGKLEAKGNGVTREGRGG